jgi:YD repeat-containing protein
VSNALGGAAQWSWGPPGSTPTTANVTVPNGALDIELTPTVTLDAPPGGNGMPANGFTPIHVTLQSSNGSACVSGGTLGAAGGSQGGTPVVTNQQGPPLVDVDASAFVYQRHASPYGAGWGLDGVDELFTNAWAEEAVVVHGNGDQERFSPRVNTTRLSTWNSNTGLARDPSTGQIFAADSSGNIDLVDPATGNLTSVLKGLGWTKSALAMTVTYVGTDRHFVVVLDGSVVDVDSASGSQRQLTTTPTGFGNDAYWGIIPAIASSGDLVFYVPGRNQPPLLQSFRLTDASPAPLNLSLTQGGQMALNPTVPVSQFTFGDPHGLAYIAGKGLYVADRQRNVIYLVAPDPSTGEVGPGSPMTAAAGSGATMTVEPIGYRSVAASAEISQPSALMDDGNGDLWVITPFGAGIFDLQANDFRFELLDASTPNSELQYHLFASGMSSFVAPGASTLLAHIAGDFVRMDVVSYSSERDPTRTLTVGASGATLTDTTADTVEAFDGSGLMLEKSLRTGEPLYSVSYLSGTDTVQSITDPTGGAVTFSYDGYGKLQSILDPVHPQTVVSVDTNGDLVALQEPDGETYRFFYDAHHMKLKTSPDGDPTSYTYAADGTISSTSKPAPGDSYTNIQPAYSQPPQLDASGHTVRVGAYTDPRGVTHQLTIDKHGNVQSDAYTADGVPYTRAYELPATIGPTTQGLYAERGNWTIGRLTAWTLNGLEVTLPRQYDTQGRLTFVTEQFNTSTAVTEQFSYDASGRLLGYYRPPGNDWFLMARDAAGHLLNVTEQGNGRELAFTWNGPGGQPDTVTEHKVTTMVGFDAQGNPSAFSDSMGRLWTRARDTAGNVVTSSDSVATWHYAYDANNRLVTATDGASSTTTYGYTQTGCGCSQADLVTSIATPDLPPSLAWALSWGPEGRLATLTDPDGQSESYAYEPTGELRSVVDRDGNSTSITHDQLGRTKAITDALGRMHPKTYPLPTATQWTGARMLAGSADGSTPATDLTSVLRNGDYQIGARTFDAETVSGGGKMSRGVPQISFYRDATMQVSYGLRYDVGLRVTDVNDRSALSFSSDVVDTGVNTGPFVGLQYTYTPYLPIPLKTADSENFNGGGPNGKLGYGSASDPYDLVSSIGFGTGLPPPTEYFYSVDTAGRRTGTTRQYAHAYPGPTSGYVYHPTSDRIVQDNLVSLASPPDPTETRSITYDARGLVHTIAAPEGTYTFDGYDAVGRNTHLTYPDGHTRRQQYDHEGRITQRCYEYTNGATNRCYGASYDAAGNVTQLTDPEGTDNVTFDALYRLTQVDRSIPNAPDVVETYAYNALGALNSNAPVATGVELNDQRPILGGTGTAGSAVMSSADGLPITVDGAGRLTSLEGATLQFDKEGLLWSISSGSNTESFVYDEQFRVASRMHNGANVETYVYDGPNVEALLAPSGKFMLTWLYDGVDSPLRVTQPQVSGRPVLYYELDLAGNVRRLRTAGGGDAGGYRYSAFGVSYAPDSGTPQPTLVQPLQWKGRWFFGLAGGVYNVRARWWSPRAAEFLGIDAFRYHDRGSTLWGWPRQNPLHWSDPTGRAGLMLGASADAEIGLVIGWGGQVGGGLYYGSGGGGTWGGTNSSTYVIGAEASAGVVVGYYTGDKPEDNTQNLHVNFWVIGAEVDFGPDGSFAGIQIQVGPGPGASVGASPLDPTGDGPNYTPTDMPNYTPVPDPVCPSHE